MGRFTLQHLGVNLRLVFALAGQGQFPKGVGLLDARNARIGHRKIQAQGALYGDFEEAEVLVVKNLADALALGLVALGVDVGLNFSNGFAYVFGEVAIQAGDGGQVVRRAIGAVAHALALVAQAFLHLPGKVGGVDELHPAFALRGFAVGDDPHIGVDAGVVEELVGQANHRLQHVVFNDPAADVALATARIARKERRAVEDDGNARALATLLGRGLHFGDHVQQKEQRTVVDARQAGAKAALKAKGVVLFGDEVFLGLPLHPKRRVGQHEVKVFSGVAVAIGKAFFGLAGTQRVAKDDVVDFFTFDHQVRAANGKGLGVVLLPEQAHFGAGVEASLRVFDDLFRL